MEESTSIAEMNNASVSPQMMTEELDIGKDTSELKETEESTTSSAISTDARTNYDPKNIHYEGDIAIYTDPTSQYQFKWDKEKNEWVHYTKTEYGFEDDTHTYIDTDGVKYFWDTEKKAWFPKINDDFMAQYQMNYGFVDNTSLNLTPKVIPQTIKKETEKKVESKLPPGVKRKPSEPTWFELDESKNTKVYVSNLPTDITEEEFIELMQKYGIIMRDVNTNELKIKLYRDPETSDVKGDALCTYIKRESVDLVLKLLDGLEYRGGKRIKVEMATFTMKGSYDPKRKPKTKKRKEKEKLKRQQEKLFDWRPEKQIGERGKHEKSVILRNVFDSQEFEEDVGLILTLQDLLRDLCNKNGEVRKVIIYDRHPEGVAQVNMKEPEEADVVVMELNNTLFRMRRISAEIWDGRTKFKIAETDSEINQRLEKWEKFLETDDKNNDKTLEKETNVLSSESSNIKIDS